MEYTLNIDNQTLGVRCDIVAEGRFRFSIEDQVYEVSATPIADHHLHLVVNGHHVNAFLADTNRGKTIHMEGKVAWVEDANDLDRMEENAGAEEMAREITPPMPSVVIRTLVKEGDCVEKGQGVIVVSAMKMETTLTAPFDGRVTRIHVQEGDQVAVGQILVGLEPLPETEHEQGGMDHV